MEANTTLYDRLGIVPTADCVAIKKAFRKAAKCCHPDKHPDDPNATEKFKKIYEAYEVLIDPEKRKTYDLYGVYGTFSDPFMESYCSSLSVNSRQKPHTFTDPFAENFFVNREETRPREKCPDLYLTLQLTLEDLCKGKDQQLSVKKDKLCTCNREGMGIRSLIHCKICNGCRVIKVSEVIEIKIPVGCKNGQKIIIRGAADEAVDKDPGNVVIIIAEKQHPIFQRCNNDLYMERNITVLEALVGFKFPVSHVDGRSLVIKTKPGDIIKPGEKRTIPNEGMPISECCIKRGNLVITFSVTFPEPGQFKPQQIKCLQEAFLSCNTTFPNFCPFSKEIYLPQPLFSNKPPCGTKRPRTLYEENSSQTEKLCKSICNENGNSVQCTQS